nr:MAG TPA_asm: hypothetical protein [Caudoviricetes sp.]
MYIRPPDTPLGETWRGFPRLKFLQRWLKK